MTDLRAIIVLRAPKALLAELHARYTVAEVSPAVGDEIIVVVRSTGLRATVRALMPLADRVQIIAPQAARALARTAAARILVTHRGRAWWPNPPDVGASP